MLRDKLENLIRVRESLTLKNDKLEKDLEDAKKETENLTNEKNTTKAEIIKYKKELE